MLQEHFSFPTPTSLSQALAKYADVRGRRGKKLVGFSSTYAGIYVVRLPYGLVNADGASPQLPVKAKEQAPAAGTPAVRRRLEEKIEPKGRPASTVLMPSKPAPIKSTMHAISIDPAQAALDLKTIRNRVNLQTYEVQS